METKKATVNGSEIEYFEFTVTNFTTRFSLWDRIKILLGKPAKGWVKIYWMNDDMICKGTDTKVWVPELIKPKRKEMLMETREGRHPGLTELEERYISGTDPIEKQK